MIDIHALFKDLSEVGNALEAIAKTVDGYARRDQILATLARFDGVLDDILDEQARRSKRRRPCKRPHG